MIFLLLLLIAPTEMHFDVQAGQQIQAKFQANQEVDVTVSDGMKIKSVEQTENKIVLEAKINQLTAGTHTEYIYFTEKTNEPVAEAIGIPITLTVEETKYTEKNKEKNNLFWIILAGSIIVIGLLLTSVNIHRRKV